MELLEPRTPGLGLGLNTCWARTRVSPPPNEFELDSGLAALGLDSDSRKRGLVSRRKNYIVTTRHLVSSFVFFIDRYSLYMRFFTVFQSMSISMEAGVYVYRM